MTKSTIKFFVLVFILTIPFLILGTFVDLTKMIPIKLPISAFIFLCPISAAIILTKKEGKENGLKSLLKRIIDYQKIRNRYWLIPAFLLLPALMLLSYLIMKWLDYPLPIPNLQFVDAAIFLVIFFIGAIGEEVGWTGFVTDPLQDRFGVLKGALILGIFWAIFHIIPYSQAHRAPMWIFWQCMMTIALRIIMVWLYNKTGKSLLAVIICHTTLNVSFFLFPNNGSHYDPFIFATLIIVTSVAIACLWDTKTVSHFQGS